MVKPFLMMEHHGTLNTEADFWASLERFVRGNIFDLINLFILIHTFLLS